MIDDDSKRMAMKCGWCKRFSLFLLFIYSIFYLTFFIFNLISVPNNRRNFTKKELFEGPLLKRYQAPNLKKTGTKTISGVYVVNGRSYFDESMIDLKELNSSSPLPIISPIFIKKLVESAKSMISRHGGFPHFTLINGAYKDLTLNWLCNVAEFNKTLEKTIIVSTNESLCKKLKNEWKSVICLLLKIGDEYEGSFELGRRREYLDLIIIRTQIILHLIKHKIPFLLFETHSIWFKDPSLLFLRQDAIDDVDIVLSTKGYTHKGERYNLDAMLVYPRDGSLSLFTQMIKELIDKRTRYDQIEMNSIDDILDNLCKTQFHGVICRQFEWNQVADGKWFKLSDNERLKFHPYIVNNNYYVGIENKIARQTINGLWFLSKMSHCVALKVKKALKKYN